MWNVRSASRCRRGPLPFMRIVLLVAVLALAGIAPASAAERGVITGRVINETTGKPAAGAEVTLAAADEDGSGRVQRSVTTGKDGTYRFDGLPSGTSWLYIVDARFDGGLFPGSPFRFPPGERPLLETSLRVWNTTTDPNSIIIARDAMFVLPSDDSEENSVGVIESVTVLNQTDFAYIGRGMTDGSAGETTFGFGLPAGAGDVRVENASFDVPELVETDFGFGITVALPPDETDFTYSYRVPADALTYVLSKTALYPTADLLVFAGAPLKIQSDRLDAKGTETIEGKTYERWEAPGLVDAGDTVLIQASAEADMQWWPFALGAGGLVAAIAAGYVLMRRKPGPVPKARRSREELIAAIASLDVAYESGDVKEAEWESERAKLKSLLVETDNA
jgi:hypothetical protein